MSGLDHPRARALCAGLKENHSDTVFLEICPEGGRPPRGIQLSLLDDVKARGDHGAHPAWGTSAQGLRMSLVEQARWHPGLGCSAVFVGVVLVSRAFIRISKGSLPLKCSEALVHFTGGEIEAQRM